MAGPRVAVVGAGAWGTTLAAIVAKREPVLLLCHREELADELNRVLMAATERTPPPPVRGKRPKLFYATQAAISPPTFVFFASDASLIHFSYRRYLENRLRDQFGFDGTPIRLVFRDRSSVKLPRRKKARSAPVKSRRSAAASKPRRS